MRRWAAPAVVLAVAAILGSPAAATEGAGPPFSARGVAGADAEQWHLDGPIVFSRSAEDGADLWSVGINGSRLRRLTSSRKDDTEPAWAPRGLTIVFVRTGPKGRPDLYTMDLRGGRPTLLLRDAFTPTWSPDGSRIAFARTVEGNTDVYSAAADGSDIRRVTTDPAVDTDPTWWPDGSRLAFATDRDGDFEIHAVDLDGSGDEALTDDELDQRNPWLPWSWRHLVYDEGPDEDPTSCGVSLGIPVDSEEGRETWCHDDGRHSATGGPFGPYAWISTRPNGSTHLVAWNGPGALHQLTGGRRSVADPAFRPAAPVMLHGLADAAHDLDLAVKAAHAWYLANGTLAGADESATGLISFESSLCLVSAGVRSQANSSMCTSGAGTGSTSVYADEGEVALARDTGVGICLYSKYWTFGSIRLSTVGLTTTADDCRGEDARAAAQVSW